MENFLRYRATVIQFCARPTVRGPIMCRRSPIWWRPVPTRMMKPPTKQRPRTFRGPLIDLN